MSKIWKLLSLALKGEVKLRDRKGGGAAHTDAGGSHDVRPSAVEGAAEERRTGGKNCGSDKLCARLDCNKSELLESLHNTSDVKSREFMLSNGTRAIAFFLEGVADQEAQRDIMYRMMSCEMDAADPIKSLMDKVITVFGCNDESSLEKLTEAILKGDTVIMLEGEERALVVATAMWQTRSIGEPPTSSVLMGPREGFTEDIKTNITQVRRRLRTPDLMVDRLDIGRYSNTDVAVVYIKGVADPKIVRKVKERLAKIEIDALIDSYYVQQYLEEHNGSLFRQVGVCEKPDILCAKILEGRIGVMVNGSPMVLTVPFLMLEDLQQSEDYYTRNFRAVFLRAIRLLALMLGMLLPGIYVAVQIYHYTVIPQEYLFTLMNAIQGLPMTPLMEMLFVILLFEIIHEASIRMPRYVGMAMSIVGALVLGETAVKAGLISSPAIMIVALSSIALYTVPDQVGAFKLLRILYTAVAGISGLLGLIVAGLATVIYLAGLDTYGTPYLAPFAPHIEQDLADGILKRSMTVHKTRPYSIPNVNKTRGK